MLKFETLDAEGLPIELDPAAGGLISWMLVETEDEAAQHGVPLGEYRPVSLQLLPGALSGYPAELLTRFRITSAEVPDPEPEAPIIVSRMQLRRQLLRMPRTDEGEGALLDQFDAAVEAAVASGTLEGRDLGEYWTQTSEFHRTHATLIAFAASQDVDEAAIAEAWSAASLLN